MTTDIGLARGIDAQSFGQPGQRTFRLRMAGESGDSASLWMEKEQFQALAEALNQMLAQLEYDQEPPAADVGEFPTVAAHDFRVGRMGMGFQASDRTIVLLMYEVGVEDEEDPTVRGRITQEQGASLRVQLLDIVSGGRPICPLCGLSIEPAGHACVRSNGHSKQPIPDEEPDDDSDEP